MIHKYRTKPVEIEVVQYDGENFGIVSSFASEAGYYVEEAYINGERFLYVYSDDGRMKADIGDFVIKGLRGEIYSSKPDVFHKKYERVER